MKINLTKFLIVIVIGVVGAAIFYLKYLPNRNEHVHYHAGFIVYIDDVKQDYSDYKYMSIALCSEDEEKKSKEDEQIEKAHLHDGVGDVLHIESERAKWGDLFKNINVKFPSDKKLVGYINGIENQAVLQAPIKEYTTAVFLIGDTSASRSGETVSTERIKEVEAKSELCGVDN